MTITVLDTFTGIDTVLRSPAAERSARLTAMLTPMAGMYRYFPGEVDLEAMHRMSFGFPIDRDNDACSDALATLHEADAWGRISRTLDGALAVQLAAIPNIEIPDIAVLIVLGGPGDAYFMESAKGMSGNGSAFGYVSLTFWPAPENLARLESSRYTGQVGAGWITFCYHGSSVTEMSVRRSGFWFGSVVQQRKWFLIPDLRYLHLDVRHVRR